MHKAELFNCYSIRKIGGLKRAYEYIWILLMLTFFAEEDERLSINGKPLDASRLAHTLGIDEALASEALVVLEAFDFIEKVDSDYFLNTYMLKNRITLKNE